MHPLLKKSQPEYTVFSIQPLTFHNEQNRFEYPLGATGAFNIGFGYLMSVLGTQGVKMYIRFDNGNYLFGKRTLTQIQIGKYEVGVGETILNTQSITWSEIGAGDFNVNRNSAGVYDFFLSDGVDFKRYSTTLTGFDGNVVNVEGTMNRENGNTGSCFWSALNFYGYPTTNGRYFNSSYLDFSTAEDNSKIEDFPVNIGQQRVATAVKGKWNFLAGILQDNDSGHEKHFAISKPADTLPNDEVEVSAKLEVPASGYFAGGVVAAYINKNHYIAGLCTSRGFGIYQNISGSESITYESSNTVSPGAEYRLKLRFAPNTDTSIFLTANGIQKVSEPIDASFSGTEGSGCFGFIQYNSVISGTGYGPGNNYNEYFTDNIQFKDLFYSKV